MKVRYFSNQIEEIRSEKSLCLYGFFLSLIHCATYFYWGPLGTSGTKKLNEGFEICWSFYQNCNVTRSFFAANFDWIAGVYLVASLFVSISFLRPRFITKAYWGLFAITLLKFIILIQDYRFMGNYHYMQMVAILFFLFVPHKIRYCKFILVGFYLASGRLRFNQDWLSGESIMMNHPFISGKALEWAQAYVAVLETIFPFLLLSTNPLFFWTAFAQFVIFHCLSFYLVGYFFPLVMLFLISIFALDRQMPQKYFSKLSKIWGLSLIFTFALAQIYPALRYPDSAITGAGRLLSINMFDALAVC